VDKIRVASPGVLGGTRQAKHTLKRPPAACLPSFERLHQFEEERGCLGALSADDDAGGGGALLVD